MIAGEVIRVRGARENNLKEASASRRQDPPRMLPTPSITAQLSPIGLSDFDERLYEAIIDNRGLPLAELAQTTGLSERQAARSLRILEASGLVSRSPTRPPRFLAAPPDMAIEVLVLRRQEELERTRLAVRHFSDRFRRASSTAAVEVVEILVGRDAQVQRVMQLFTHVQKQLLVFDKEPYVIGAAGTKDAELELLRRRVEVRGVYDDEVLRRPGAPDEMVSMGEAGEQARVMRGVPMKLLIADGELALVPLSLNTPGGAVVVVHRSALLDALTTLFETLWDRAVPLDHVTGGSAIGTRGRGLSATDQRILMLLSLGTKEQSIAMNLGLNERTIGRHIERMMMKYGVRTRFQLGQKVAEDVRRGDVSDDQ
jgi:DNA-binding CsgD family transcriptional regulator/sugar-specific transcriptional regulator TrmB